MQAEFKATSAPALDKPKDLAGILTSLGENSVFFIDEIHRLKPVVEEMLYIAMEDNEIDWVIGQGPAARDHSYSDPPFYLDWSYYQGRAGCRAAVQPFRNLISDEFL